MLIHRAPLLTPTPSPFDQSYHQYSSSLRLALSNPVPAEFYFKKGSLTERRFLRAQWQREKAIFGEKLAGKQPDVGELPVEEEPKLNVREQEGEIDDPSAKDAKKIERNGEGNLYLVVKDKNSGKWSLPAGSLGKGEALHEVCACSRGARHKIELITACELLQAASRIVSTQVGEDMDLWLVTRKPIGLIEDDSDKVRSGSFFDESITCRPPD
jgi:large subunit ribosomal protein L46